MTPWCRLHASTGTRQGRTLPTGTSVFPPSPPFSEPFHLLSADWSRHQGRFHARVSSSFLVSRGGVMVYRGGRGGWQEGGGGKGGGHHETNGRGGGGQDRSRRNQGPRQPGRRPREKSMAWVPPNSARWAPRPMTLPVIMQAARSVA